MLGWQTKILNKQKNEVNNNPKWNRKRQVPKWTGQERKRETSTKWFWDRNINEYVLSNRTVCFFSLSLAFLCSVFFLLSTVHNTVHKISPDDEVMFHSIVRYFSFQFRAKLKWSVHANTMPDRENDRYTKKINSNITR